MTLPISACLIAKNSEKTIDKCLSSLKGIANEIVLIDTGSTDKTLKIAEKYNCKIYSFAWKNDFSYFRNKAIEHSSNKWILIIDTDEELILNNKTRFQELLNYPNLDSFYIFRRDILNEEENAFNIFARIFLKASNYKFVGQIHEYLSVNSDKTALIDKKTLYLNHYGYNKEYSKPLEKYNRNIEILRLQINNPIIDFWNKVYFSVCLAKELLFDPSNYLEVKELIKKIEVDLSKVSEIEIRKNTICLEFHKTVSTFYLMTKNIKDAEVILKKSLERYPNDVTIISMAGDLFFQKKDFLKSLKLYSSVIELVKFNKQLLASSNHEGTLSYGTYYNIALCYYHLQDYKSSFESIEISLDIKPTFQPSVDLLKKLKIKFLENNKN